MAIKLISNKFNFALGASVKKFIMDSDADVASLPECNPGSMAIVAEGGKAYVVNASGAWVEHGSPITSAIDDYMEEALGGDY